MFGSEDHVPHIYLHDGRLLKRAGKGKQAQLRRIDVHGDPVLATGPLAKHGTQLAGEVQVLRRFKQTSSFLQFLPSFDDEAYTSLIRWWVGRG